MSDFLFKFACFDCCVSFKRRAADNPENHSAHLPESEIEQYCPNCKNKMAFMGRNFQSPPKNDSSGWNTSRLLWENGYRYVGSGSHESPSLPRKQVEVKRFILDNPTHALKVGTSYKWEEYRHLPIIKL